MIKIYGTGKSQWMPKDAVFHEGEELAKILVEIGAATYEEGAAYEKDTNGVYNAPNEAKGQPITQKSKKK